MLVSKSSQKLRHIPATTHFLQLTDSIGTVEVKRGMSIYRRKEEYYDGDSN